jgi:hypothetical protein
MWMGRESVEINRDASSSAKVIGEIVSGRRVQGHDLPVGIGVASKIFVYELG